MKTQQSHQKEENTMQVLLTTPVNRSYTATLNTKTGQIESGDQYNIAFDISTADIEALNEKGVFVYMDGDSPLVITFAKDQSQSKKDTCTIYLDEEWGYKIYLLVAEISATDLKRVWDKVREEKGEDFFYGSALSFFRENGIKFTAKELEFGEHPYYGTGRYILKPGFENHSEALSVENTPGAYTSVKGFTADVSMHIHDWDDSAMSIRKIRL